MVLIVRERIRSLLNLDGPLGDQDPTIPGLPASPPLVLIE